ncbi:hypothetical protein [Sporocytophaga myxococcoides]|nr:hypothetical protein [Sporocytophaga myxococcoides]
MKTIHILFIIWVLPSCRDKESTHSESFIINTSNHEIKILPYDDGNLINGDIKSIPANSTIKVLALTTRGKSTGPSYANNIMFFDSLNIVFDDTISSVHYRQNLSGDNPEAIKFENNRNLYNEDNYVRKVVMEKKHYISTEYSFTFTEQDYLNAKN